MCKHEGIRYQCNLCEKAYTENSGLISHDKSKHSEKVTYKCEHCDHEAKTEELLKRHISSMKKYNEVTHQYDA